MLTHAGKILCIRRVVRTIKTELIYKSGGHGSSNSIWTANAK